MRIIYLGAALLFLLFLSHIPVQAVDLADPGESLPDMGPDFDFDDVIESHLSSEIEEIQKEVRDNDVKNQQQIGQDIWDAINQAIEMWGAPAIQPNTPAMKRALTHPRLLAWKHDNTGMVVAKIGYHVPLRCERLLDMFPLSTAYKKGEFYYGKTRWNQCVAKAYLYIPYPFYTYISVQGE
jgi:hypothetical protein